MTAIMEARNLTRRFGGLAAVDGISFTLKQGDMTALIGPNGAGKTTCFNLLSGVLPVSSGSVLFAGLDISDLPPHRRATLGIGRTFQIAAVFRSMTITENVETALMAAGRRIDETAQLLEDAGLAAADQRPVNDLAYGDVKRLELAMALAAQPKLLLLDEPTAGMNGAERRGIMETIASLARARQMTLLFTEHDMDAVFGFASRVLVMDQGNLIADGPPETIRNDPRVQSVYLGDMAVTDA